MNGLSAAIIGRKIITLFCFLLIKNSTLCFLFLALLKYEELLNNFKDFILVHQWRRQQGNYMYVLKRLRAAKIQRFLVDIPYWKVKQFLIIVSMNNAAY